MPMRGAILVVDDDESICDLISEFLADEGYVVRTVKSALEGYVALTEGYPDLILCDYHLPGIDGLSFASNVRHGGVNIPIVLMTADRHPPSPMVGIADYLFKPFHLDTLLNCIEIYTVAKDM